MAIKTLYHNQNDSSSYYKGVIIVTDPLTNETQQLPIAFDVVPQRPKIIECSWHNIAYSENLPIEYSSIKTDSSYFQIKLLSDNDVSIIKMEYATQYYSKGHNDTTIIWDNFIEYFHGDNLNINNDTITINNRHSDWGEYYRLTLSNDFGVNTCRELILTTDYIDDQEILHSIDLFLDIWWGNAGINDFVVSSKNDTSFYSITGNVLTLNISDYSIEQTDIYNSNGQLVLNSGNYDSINISDLSPGIYFLRCLVSNNKLLTAKFIKQ